MTLSNHESLMFFVLSGGLLLLCLSLCFILLAGVRCLRTEKNVGRGSAAAIILFLCQVPLWFLLQSLLTPPFPLYRSELCLAVIIVLLIASAYFGARAHNQVGRRALAAAISCLVGYGLLAVFTYWPMLRIRR